MLTCFLTGGIATGKSLAGRHFREGRDDVAFFDCDACVHDLLADREMARRVAWEFGDQVLAGDGKVDRPALREAVFGNDEARRRLEGLLHPEVRRECLAAKAAAAQNPAIRVFLAEVPVLYESGFDVERDCEIVVAVSPEVQRQRMIERRGLAPEMVERILTAQWPILEKVRRAHIVIWNGGSLECLKRQAHCLRRRLKMPL